MVSGRADKDLAGEVALTRGGVQEFVTRVLVEIGRIAPDNIFDGATLDGDLKMESVALIEVQVALEERFAIEIDLIQVVEINQLAGIIDYIYDLACQAVFAGGVANS